MGKRKRVRKAREGGSWDAGGRVVRRTGRPVVLLRGGVLKPILNILLALKKKYVSFTNYLKTLLHFLIKFVQAATSVPKLL